MLGLLTRHKWLMAASALLLALIALWLAARPAGEPPRAVKSPAPVPTTNAGPELAFFSPFSPLPTPAPTPTVAAPTRPSVHQVRPIDGTTVLGGRLRVTEEPTVAPTPWSDSRIAAVQLGSDLRVAFLDNDQAFIYDLTDGSLRPRAPGDDLAFAATPPVAQSGSASPDGRLVTMPEGMGGGAATVIRERSGLTRTLRLPGVTRVYWSPDDRYVLGMGVPTPTQPTLLLLADLVQWRSFTLTRAWQGEITPVWAPGSRRLAFAIRAGADAGLWLLDIANDWVNPLAPGSDTLTYDAIQWTADDELIARQVQLMAGAAPQGRALLRFRQNGEYVYELAGRAMGVSTGYRRLPSSTVFQSRQTYGMLLPYEPSAASGAPTASAVVPLPSPTADSPGAAAARLLAVPEQGYCPSYTYRSECVTPLVTAILDFLTQYPDRPEAAALRDRVIVLRQWAFGYAQPADWLLTAWLDARVRQPFDLAGGLPADFRDQWQPWGQVFETDLDGDGQADYLLTARTGPYYECDYLGGLWWLRRQGAGYVLAPLLTTTPYEIDPGPARFPDVKTIADLNGDGRIEMRVVESHGVAAYTRLAGRPLAQSPVQQLLESHEWRMANSRRRWRWPG